VSTDNGLALGLIVEEAVDLGDSAVEGANGETVVGHVEDQVLAPTQFLRQPDTRGRRLTVGVDLHDGQADEAEISAFNIVSIPLDLVLQRGSRRFNSSANVEARQAGAE